MEKIKPCCKNERWKAIRGTFGMYRISSCGRVLSFFKIPSRLKITFADKDGYLHVGLYGKITKKGPYLVSRLVLTSFVGNPPTPKHEASHLNGDCKNNHLSNLRWETRQENEDRKELHGRRLYGERNRSAKINQKTADKIRALKQKGFLQTELARMFSLTTANISHIVRGNTWNRRASDEKVSVKE